MLDGLGEAAVGALQAPARRVKFQPGAAFLAGESVPNGCASVATLRGTFVQGRRLVGHCLKPSGEGCQRCKPVGDSGEVILACVLYRLSGIFSLAQAFRPGEGAVNRVISGLQALTVKG